MVTKTLYWKQQATVKIEGKSFEYSKTEKEIRQGCVLWPDLVNLYDERLSKKSKEIGEVRIGGRKLNNIRYTNDAVML